MGLLGSKINNWQFHRSLLLMRRLIVRARFVKLVKVLLGRRMRRGRVPIRRHVTLMVVRLRVIVATICSELGIVRIIVLVNLVIGI